MWPSPFYIYEMNYSSTFLSNSCVRSGFTHLSDRHTPYLLCRFAHYICSHIENAPIGCNLIPILYRTTPFSPIAANVWIWCICELVLLVLLLLVVGCQISNLMRIHLPPNCMKMLNISIFVQFFHPFCPLSMLRFFSFHPFLVISVCWRRFSFSFH